MKIVVKKDKVFGNIVIYPICDNAKLFAEIAGTKTLTHATLTRIERLGYEITLQQETL